MKKRKFIKILVLILVVLLIAATVFFYYMNAIIKAAGEKLELYVLGKDSGKLDIYLVGEFPDDADFGPVIPTAFYGFTDTGTDLVSNYTDMLEFSELDSGVLQYILDLFKTGKEVKRFKATALTQGDGRLELTFCKNDIRQTEAVIDITIDENIKFTSVVPGFDEEKEIDTVILAEFFDADIQRITDGLSILISKGESGTEDYWLIEEYDHSVISYAVLTYSNDNKSMELKLIARSEGFANVELINVYENKLLTLSFNSSLSESGLSGSVYRLELTGSVYEEIESEEEGAFFEEIPLEELDLRTM